MADRSESQAERPGIGKAAVQRRQGHRQGGQLLRGEINLGQAEILLAEKIELRLARVGGVGTGDLEEHQIGGRVVEHAGERAAAPEE